MAHSHTVGRGGAGIWAPICQPGELGSQRLHEMWVLRMGGRETYDLGLSPRKQI